MWDGFCEHLKECGRNGTIFVFAVATVIVSPFLAMWMGAYASYAVGGFAGWLVYHSVASIVRQCRGYEKLGKMPPLSQNEWKAARKKLLINRNLR